MSQRWVQNQKGTIELDQKGEHDLNEACSTAGRMGGESPGFTAPAGLKWWEFRAGNTVREIIEIVRDVANGQISEQPDPLDDGLPGG